MKKQGLIAVFALAAAMAVGTAVLAADAAPRIGDKVSDDTVYAGVSPETNKNLYTTPADAPGLFTWNRADEYCSALEAGGHQDWRVPTKSELNVLFNNRADIGGFDETGSYPAGWHWSSTPGVSDYFAWAQRFGDGYQDIIYRNGNDDSSLRCVRERHYPPLGRPREALTQEPR